MLRRRGARIAGIVCTMFRVASTVPASWSLIALLVVLLSSTACESVAGDGAPAVDTGVRVVETMDSGGYTYVKLEAGEGAQWYAVPECEVAVGDRVQVAAGAMAMRDFESRTLDRTFPLIYFAGSLEVVGGS